MLQSSVASAKAVPWGRGLPARLNAETGSPAFTVDGTGFPKAGRYSAGLTRQYSGTLGKIGNCSIGVLRICATEAASCPLLAPVLSTAWEDDAERRVHKQELSSAWLLCQREEEKDEPSKYWLSNLPEETEIADLVRLAKPRWRIEQDYRLSAHATVTRANVV